MALPYRNFNSLIAELKYLTNYWFLQNGNPAGIYLSKANNENSRKTHEIC